MRKIEKSVGNLLTKIKKYRRVIIITALLIVGFLVRVYFADKFIKESGDLNVNAEWGEKFWEYGSKEFYFAKDWYYARPNYPPISSLIYAAAYWLYDHKYILPRIHNATKLVPAFFIVYFYENGYHLLLKLPGILADLGLSIIIYQLVHKLTRSPKSSFLASSFYLFNPISVFLSGGWGQSDSLVALLGLLSFLALFEKKVWLSIPLLFISFYIKPNWGVFIPLYAYLMIVKRPKLTQIFTGLLISFVIFYLTTLPFTNENIFSFTKYLLEERILATATVSHKASISAFNLHTIFFEIDKTSDKVNLLGIPANILGLILFTFSNIFSFLYLKRKKYSLESVMTALFVVGFSSYIFLTGMLERYFFASFVPMIIVTFSEPKVFLYVSFIVIATFLNLIYAFFRRTIGEIADFFTHDNFIVIRLLSFTSLVSWFVTLRKIKFFTK